jgi:hypothetical protein
MSVKKLKKDLVASYLETMVLREKFPGGPQALFALPNYSEKCFALLRQFRELKTSYFIKVDSEELKLQIGYLHSYGSCLIDCIEIILFQNNFYDKGFLSCERNKDSVRIQKLVSEFLDFKQEAFACFDQIYEFDVSKLIDFKVLVNDIEKNKKRILIQKIYFLMSCDLDTFENDYVSLLKEASGYGSSQADSSLVEYYVRQGEEYLDIAHKYFLRCISNKFASGYYNAKESNSVAQIMAHRYLYNGYYSKGMLEKAKEIATQAILFIGGLEKITTFDGIKQIAIKGFQGNLSDIQNKLNPLPLQEKVQHKEYIEYFKDKSIIPLMSDSVKTYLQTAIRIYQFMVNQDNLDFSAFTMPLMKALESVLFDIFAKHYFEYVKSIEGIAMSDIPRFMKTKEDNPELLSSISFIELGDVLKSMSVYRPKDPSQDIQLQLDGLEDNIVNELKKYNPRKYFLSFCQSYNVDEPILTIQTFSYYLFKIKEIRNLSAHRNRVYKQDANKCLDYLLTSVSFLEFLFVKFRFCFETESSKSKPIIV